MLFQSTKQKRVSFVVFGIYLVFLIWLVLFKFSVNLSDLPNIRGINLIPFYYDRETNVHLSEIVYNVLVFVPLGVYIQIFLNDRNVAVKCLIVLLTSFLFEVAQYVFAIGASDITDIIGNTLGGFLGIVFCIVMSKKLPEKYISLINTLGLVIEIGAAGLMVLLFVANS